MKIKIEREDKTDLVVAGKVFVKGRLYRVTAGEDQNHAYHLKHIYKEGRDWMLRMGEQSYDAEIRYQDLEETSIADCRKCDCSFTCEGYVMKNFTWI